MSRRHGRSRESIGQTGAARDRYGPTRRNPRSVTRAAGMTESAMNASNPNGEGRSLPRSLRGRFQRRVGRRDLGERPVGEQTGDRQRQVREDLPAGHGGQPTLALGDGRDRGQDVGVVDADRDDVVGVVGDRAGERAAA